MGSAFARIVFRFRSRIAIPFPFRPLGLARHCGAAHHFPFELAAPTITLIPRHLACDSAVRCRSASRYAASDTHAGFSAVYRDTDSFVHLHRQTTALPHPKVTRPKGWGGSEVIRVRLIRSFRFTSNLSNPFDLFVVFPCLSSVFLRTIYRVDGSHFESSLETLFRPRGLDTTLQITGDSQRPQSRAASSYGQQADVLEWISLAFFRMTPRPRQARARLVTDYTALNRFVTTPGLVHPFPLPVDVMRLIKPESKVFAKLDAYSGYFQIPLEPESSLMTTFILPSGKYRYTRAPMGLNASSDEFCRRTDEALAGSTALSRWSTTSSSRPKTTTS
jgi:hypothetical protein